MAGANAVLEVPRPKHLESVAKSLGREALNAQRQVARAREHVGKLNPPDEPKTGWWEVSSLAPPIAELTTLTSGWDGEGAPTPSAELITRAQELWDILDYNSLIQMEPPTVFPGRDEVIGFTWQRAADRRLDIWVRSKDEGCFADWALTTGNSEPMAAEVMRADDLLEIVFKYLTE